MLPLAFLGSPADIGIILVLALIVFGPKRLPEVGKQLGQAMRELRKVTEELTGAVHSVHSEVESVYKPVLTPPHDYVNPYMSTSSPTVEKAAAHRPYDQEPEDLMAPAVPPHKLEAEPTPPAPDSADVKGN
jgi:sec-independent protein translocase protein TatA